MLQQAVWQAGTALTMANDRDRPALGSTQSPTQAVTGTFPGLKRPGRGIDYPPQFSATVKERVDTHLVPLWTFVACSQVNVDLRESCWALLNADLRESCWALLNADLRESCWALLNSDLRESCWALLNAVTNMQLRQK
jgi:hypothetical protein